MHKFLRQYGRDSNETPTRHAAKGGKYAQNPVR